tara:strand:+ start:359 stop:847 length:489 start_codon:yes stop_codon:yes gene_type:complete
MANNVYSTIKIEKGNYDVNQEFVRVFTDLEKFYETDIAYCDFFKTNEEIVDNEFMETWVGPRQAELTKFMGTEVEIKSAWISPHVFFMNLLEHLRSFDEEIVMSMAYDDEFLMFAGVYVNEKMQEESGGWFKTEFDRLESDNSNDFLGFVTEMVDKWRIELC